MLHFDFSCHSVTTTTCTQLLAHNVEDKGAINSHQVKEKRRKKNCILSLICMKLGDRDDHVSKGYKKLLNPEKQ